MYGTNPFSQFFNPGTKEHIDLNKQATINYTPLKTFDLIPENADGFCSSITDATEDYAYYGMIWSVPTTRTVDPDDATITFGGQTNIINSWHQISLTHTQQNATQTWGATTGANSWIDTSDKQIIALSAGRGEITGGRTPTLNDAGKKKFMARKKSTWLAHHCFSLLGAFGSMIKVHRDEYTWYDSETGDTIHDGLTVLYFCLQHLRPHVRINVFNEIKKIKDLKPKNFNNDVSKWLTAMDATHIAINHKNSECIQSDSVHDGSF